MAINITQFAPPSTVSSLVWDENMEPPAGKVFEGDLVGDVTGKTMYAWTTSPKATVVTLRMAANSTTQIYQLSPCDTLTGTISCYIVSPTQPAEDVSLVCISRNWDYLLNTQLSITTETFTLPEGTNGIYITNFNTDVCFIRMYRFNIS